MLTDISQLVGNLFYAEQCFDQEAFRRLHPGAERHLARRNAEDRRKLAPQRVVIRHLLYPPRKLRGPAGRFLNRLPEPQYLGAPCRRRD